MNAREVAPAWSTTLCEEVLDVVSGVPARIALQSALNLDQLRCKMRIIPDSVRETERVIFSDAGLDLQLEMRMSPNAGAGIFTPAIAAAPLAARRTLLMRRLADLAEYGTLRKELYPSEARAPRFARILQALDGSMTGARHREIAVSLFGEARVRQDWSAPDNHLRDHVRRAIANGKTLLAGGFSRLLA